MIRLALVAGALLAVIHISGQPEAFQPARPFWELQGTGPGAREAGDVVALRTAARDAAAPDMVVVVR